MRRAWRAGVCCLLLALPVAIGAQQDRDIALLYVEAAYDAYRDGRLERARRLSDVAREFAPASSDALYVAALLAAEDRSEIRSSIDLTARALQAARWQSFRETHAAVLAARLWNRVGEHEEAALLLGRTTLLPDTAAALRSSYYYERARALHELGREAERDAVLDLARDRFPDDPRLVWFMIRSEPFPSVEYRRELERLIRADASSEYGPDLDDLLFEYGMRAPVPQEAAWALSELDGRGWSEPRLALLELDLDAERAVDRFLARDGWTDYRTGRALLTRVETEYADRLGEAAREYTGMSVIDDDRDGVWNERIAVADGMVTRWERDADQDGQAEVDLSFAGDEPAAVRLAAPGVPPVDLEYGQYPFVSRASIGAEIGSELFVLRPRSVRLEALEELPSAGPVFGSVVELVDEPRTVERDELVSAAIRIDLVREDGTVAERTFREAGVARQIMRDGDGDGAWDHLLLSDGGFATSGVRDLDGDGYYEVAEGYRNGRLVALAVDSDDDGEPEVFEREAGVPVREWDINGDGVIDVREFSWWTDEVIREFPLAEQRR